MKIIIIIVILFLLGCSPPPDFHKVIVIGDLNIHVVSDRKYFQLDEMRNNPNIMGYANGFEIWIIGTKKKGKIYIDSVLMGHEFRHVLSKRDVEFCNPDWEI